MVVIVMVIVEKGFAITRIISDLTDEKAMQGFENLQLGEAKSVLFLQKSRRVGGKIRLIRDICG